MGHAPSGGPFLPLLLLWLRCSQFLVTSLSTLLPYLMMTPVTRLGHSYPLLTHFQIKSCSQVSGGRCTRLLQDIFQSMGMEKQWSDSQRLTCGVFLMSSLPVRLMPSALTLPGVVGDWREHFTPELNKKFNAVYQSKMGNSGLCLPWTMD